MIEQRCLPGDIVIKRVSGKSRAVIPLLVALNAAGNIDTYPSATGIPEVIIRERYGEEFRIRKQDEFERFLASSSTAVFVAYSGNDIVGYNMSEIGDKRNELSGLQVAQRRRREGIGTALAKEGILWLREQRPADIFLTVVRHTPARLLYRSLLFEDTGIQETFEIGGTPVYLEEMRLSKADSYKL